MKIELDRTLIFGIIAAAFQFPGHALADPIDKKAEGTAHSSKSVLVTYLPNARSSLYIALHRTQSVTLTNIAVKAVTSDPTKVDAKIASANKLRIRGNLPGTTDIVITDKSGKEIVVGASVLDYDALRSTLRCIDPRIICNHRLTHGGEQLVLSGKVTKPEIIIRAYWAGLVFMDDRGINWQGEDGTPVRFPGGGCGAGWINADDPSYKIGSSKLISDGHRVLSLLTTQASKE